MPGDICDLHSDLPREFGQSIQMLTPASVAPIPTAEMSALMEGRPNIVRAMYTAKLVEKAALRAWIVSMGRRRSIERVANLICELYRRARDMGLTEEREFTLPVSQLMLADALGMTPPHVNRF